MKNQLALWSWILTILGFFFYPSLQIIEDIINIQRCGYPIFAENVCASHIFTSELIGPLTLLLMISAALIGLIFGIISIKKISSNSALTGKVHAIVGIILNVILLLYGLFAFVGGIFA